MVSPHTDDRESAPAGVRHPGASLRSQKQWWGQGQANKQLTTGKQSGSSMHLVSSWAHWSVAAASPHVVQAASGASGSEEHVVASHDVAHTFVLHKQGAR